MPPNSVYQAIIAALESVLPPRVVSLVLREGLTQVGRTAADLRLEDVEPILTGPAFRRLQTTMSAEQARAAVEGFLASVPAAVEAAPEETSTPPTGAAQADGDADSGRARLEALRDALRPFNLYFDWPEVRKLRAQLQLAEEEVEANLDAGASLDEAHAQLEVVRQKLEDRLVIQARELAELEEAFEVVVSLGGPRVRRLDALIGQIRQAQRSREVAEAEIERAAGIARDLRKLMESSVAQPIAADDAIAPFAETTHDDATPSSDDDLPAVSIDETQLPAEVSERLRRLDLEGEAKAVAQLADAHAELLRFLPHLERAFETARASIDAGRLLGDALESLRADLLEATQTQREHLSEEFAALEAQLDALQGDDDDGALERALRVAKGVLDDGLPSFADVTRVRELHDALLSRHAARQRREEEQRARDSLRRETQRSLLERLRGLEQAGRSAEAGLETQRRSLHDATERLARAEADDRLDDDAIQTALEAEQVWERALAAHSDDARARHTARVRALLARLGSIADHAALAQRRERLQRDLETAAHDASLGERHVETLGSMVEQLYADALDASARQLEQLAREAGETTDADVLDTFKEATRTIEAGAFPDLPAIAHRVATTLARQRDDEQRRWHDLQRAKLRYDAAAVPALVTLSGHMDRVQATLQRGQRAAAELAQAEAALSQVEREVAERLERFGPRLDAALETLVRVERLNNDDVAAVRRVLYHLDSQREALPRVSPGLQHQLDRALADAERRLPELEEAYEATRAIADRLVESNLFDDILSAFGDSDQAAPEPDPSRTWSDADALHTLIASFRALDDVEAAAVVSGDGRLRSGDLGDLTLASLVPALRIADASWAALGGALGERAHDLVDLALGSRRALLTPVGDDVHAVVVMRSSGAVSALAARLRHHREALVEAVAHAT